MRPIRLLILLLAIALALVLALVRPLQGRASASEQAARAHPAVRPCRRRTLYLPRLLRPCLSVIASSPTPATSSACLQLWRASPGPASTARASSGSSTATSGCAAALELRRSRARPPRFAPLAEARRHCLLRRREPRRHLRRQRALHRRASPGAASGSRQWAVLRLLRRAPLPSRLALGRYFIFSAMAVSSFHAIAELVSTSGRKSHGVMP